MALLIFGAFIESHDRLTAMRLAIQGDAFSPFA
jgi:hypothetical protein